MTILTREDPTVPSTAAPWRTHLPLRDELYLLAHDDDTGKLHIHSQSLGVGLAGAVLIDLFLSGWVGIEGERIRVRRRGQVGDPIADTALAALRQARTTLTLKMWLHGLGGDLYERTCAGLVSVGVLHRVSRRRLAGLVRSDTYLAADTRYTVTARASIRYLANGHEQPNDHSAALCGLVAVLGLESFLYLDESGARLRARLRDIASGHHPDVRDILAVVDAVVGDLATAIYR
jgi:hypothetical protein